MLSWKSKKLRDEKRKARRVVRSKVAKSRALLTDKYPELKKKSLSFRQRLADTIKKISFRNIFKK